MNMRLFIENHEVELDNSVVFAITQQFEDLTNPTAIINTWSKTVSLPFTTNNNKLFNNIFNPDRLIAYPSISGVGINFNPHKKLSFRLQNDTDVVMQGYAKVNDIKKTGGKGSYNITLYGELGKVFYELKKITFDRNTDDALYLIDGSDYVNVQLNKDLIYDCWTKSAMEPYLKDSTTTDIIGFAPNNSFNDGFDYKIYQNSTFTTDSFDNTLGDSFTLATGVEPDKVIPNGLLPREIGEYRSYLQQPYIFFNKLFQIFCDKAKEVTGYDIELNNTSGWFSSTNPYYSNLVMLLKSPYKKDNENTHNNYYQSYFNPEIIFSTNNAWNISKEALLTVTDSYTEEVPLLSGRTVFRLEGNNTYILNNMCATLQLPSNVTSWRNDTALMCMISVIKNGTNEVLDNKFCAYGPNLNLEELQADNLYTFLVNNSPDEQLTNFNKWYIPFPALSLNYNSVDNNDIKIRFTFYWTGINGNVTPFNTEGMCHILFGNYNNRYIAGINIHPKLSLVTLNDLWDNEHNLFTEILKWCKMFRVFVQVDDYNKKIKFIQQHDYFNTTNIQPLDWSNKVDYSKDFTVKPMSFEKKYMVFNYKENKLAEQEDYVKKYGYNYGEKVINTNYEFNSESKSMFENVTTSVNNTDNVLSWTSLYDNKQIIYTVPNELYIQTKDKDKKYISQFGNYFFWNGLKNFDLTSPMRRVRISDDTFYQESNNLRCYTQDSQSDDYINVDTYPELSIMCTNNGTKQLCLFNTPMQSYSVYQNLDNSQGIYNMIWSNYIKERYDIQNKIVTCYIWLTIEDYKNFNFNRFIKIENQLYVINKIFDYDFTDKGTKVELITVQDYKKYYNNAVNEYLNVEYKAAPYTGSTIQILRGEMDNLQVFTSTQYKVVYVSPNLLGKGLWLNDSGVTGYFIEDWLSSGYEISTGDLYIGVGDVSSDTLDETGYFTIKNDDGISADIYVHIYSV
jgi:hypothetical protein